MANSKLSSAHVYLRQPDGQPHGEWDKLPSALVMDAAQLVKANSIEGGSSSLLWHNGRLLNRGRKQEGQYHGKISSQLSRSSGGNLTGRSSTRHSRISKCVFVPSRRCNSSIS